MDNTEREDSDGSPELSPRQRALEQLPRLPKSRPRDLTPLGFRHANQIPQDSPKALFQHCAYYKIPPEIRRHILRLAFGDFRVHMDLSYDYPDILPEDTGFLDLCHCGIANMVLDDEIERIVDKSQPKSWHWWGSICHRLPPNLDMAQVGPMTRGGSDAPWLDRCRVGQAKHCHSWPGSVPDKCRIGIMGWLTSCRQSYVEAIDVLYSTNTIIMAGEEMISSIPQLILPQRLAVITSLEISWNLKTEEVSRLSEVLDEADLFMVLKIVSINFPRLRRFYLSLEESHHLAADQDPSVWGDLISQLDNFTRDMPLLSEYAVSLPGLLFEPLFQDTLHKKAGLGCDCINSYRQVWRSLDDEMDVIHLPYVDSYPKPPHHLSSLDVDLQGYWILTGSNKLKAERQRSDRVALEVHELSMGAIAESDSAFDHLHYYEDSEEEIDHDHLYASMIMAERWLVDHEHAV